MQMRQLFLVVAVLVQIFTITTPVLAAHTSNAGAALATYKSKLYLAYQSEDRKNHIHFASVSRNGDIASSIRLPSRTSRTPSLAEFNGLLWMAFRSADRSGTIYIQSYDGTAWARPIKLTFTTQSGPALAVHNERLHLTWRGNNNNSVYHASFNGKKWSSAVKTQARSDTAPVMASFGGYLFVIGNIPDQSYMNLYLLKGGSQWVKAKRNDHSRLLDLRTNKAAALLPGDDGNVVAAVVTKDRSIKLRDFALHRWNWRELGIEPMRSYDRVGLARLGSDYYVARNYRGVIEVERMKVATD